MSDDLRQLAEATHSDDLTDAADARYRFRIAATPDVVLGLLDEIDRLRNGIRDLVSRKRAQRENAHA